MPPKTGAVASAAALPADKWKLEIHQLDVGQGDGAIVLFRKLDAITGNYEIDKSILIDAGAGWAGNNIVIPYLQRLGFSPNPGGKKLDAVVISHGDEDHIEGFTKVDKVTKDSIKKSYIDVHAPIIGQGGSYAGVHNYTRCANVAGTLGGSIWSILGINPAPVGAPDITIFVSNHHVVAGDIGTGDEKHNGTKINQDSVGCLIGFGRFCYYSAGDIGQHQEDNGLYQAASNPAVGVRPDVVKVSHHGSEHSTPAGFLDKVRAAVVSHGNGHRHPHRKVIDHIKADKVEFTYLTNPKNDSEGKIPGPMDIKENAFGTRTVVAGDNEKKLKAPKSTAPGLKKNFTTDTKGHVIVSVTDEQAHAGQFTITFERKKVAVVPVAKKIADEYRADPMEFDSLRNAVGGVLNAGHKARKPDETTKKLREIYIFENLFADDLAELFSDISREMRLDSETIRRFASRADVSERAAHLGKSYSVAIKAGRDAPGIDNKDSTISFKITDQNGDLVLKERFFKDHSGRVIRRKMEGKNLGLLERISFDDVMESSVRNAIAAEHDAELKQMLQLFAVGSEEIERNDLAKDESHERDEITRISSDRLRGVAAVEEKGDIARAEEVARADIERNFERESLLLVREKAVMEPDLPSPAPAQAAATAAASHSPSKTHS